MPKQIVLRGLLLVALVCAHGVGTTYAGEADARKELERVIAKHVTKLITIAKRYKKKDPNVAERALRAVLTLEKGNEDARKLLQEMGRLGQEVVLFGGTDKDAWHHASEPTWRIEGQELRGKADEAYLARTLEQFEGDYSVSMEARFIAPSEDGAPMFGIGGDATAGEVRTEFAVLRGLPRLSHKKDSEHNVVYRGAPDDIKPRFDPKKWNTYELAFEGDYVLVRINNQLIARRDRGKLSGGYITLVVQDCEFAIRKIVAKRYS